MEPEASLGAKMAAPKLSCVGPVVSGQGSLEKTIMPRKQKAAGKEEDQVGGGLTVKEATGMYPQELSKVMRTGNRGHRSFTKSPGVGANSVARNPHA